MGNTASNDGGRRGRRRQGVNGAARRSHPTPPPQAHPQPEITSNRYVFAAATPYQSQYPGPPPLPPTPPFYHYGYYPPPPPQTMYDPQGGGNWVGGRYPCGPMVPQPPPYVEHQKAVTIRNDVNLKKETLRMEPDVENPGRFLVSFTFDAAVAGSITVMFFAKEGEDCALMPTEETLLPSVTVEFEKGLGQKFRQPCGSGIDFTMFEEKELLKEGESDVFPLAVKAEASHSDQNESNENQKSGSTNSQITQAIFEKDKGEYQVRVVKQILRVNKMRYELQEIYGIGNSADGEADANDPGKECVICLSEPRDTTALPCRHMCMCSGCAKVLRFQTNRCPICRQPVERLLEIKVNNGPEE